MAYPQTTFAHTTIDEDCLIGRRQKAVCANTLTYQLQVLKQTGRYDAFKLKWHPVYDEPPLVKQCTFVNVSWRLTTIPGLAYTKSPFLGL